MQPNPQFKAMIASMLQSRQTSITNNDLTKHKNSETAFYVISRMVYKGTTLHSKTDPYSNEMIIEIGKGGNSLKVILGDDYSEYKRVTPIEFTSTQGKGMLHWKATDKKQKQFTVVKILSDDGYVQIKFVFPDQTSQAIYTVCELSTNR